MQNKSQHIKKKRGIPFSDISREKPKVVIRFPALSAAAVFFGYRGPLAHGREDNALVAVERGVHELDAPASSRRSLRSPTASWPRNQNL